MSDDAQTMRRHRDDLKRAYGDLYEQLCRAFFEADPIGINFGHNTDEYEPEVDTTLPRLASCSGVEDVQQVLHEEFGKWFGTDVAGPREGYAALAESTWSLWQEWRGLLGHRK